MRWFHTETGITSGRASGRAGTLDRHRGKLDATCHQHAEAGPEAAVMVRPEASNASRINHGRTKSTNKWCLCSASRPESTAAASSSIVVGVTPRCWNQNVVGITPFLGLKHNRVGNAAKENMKLPSRFSVCQRDRSELNFHSLAGRSRKISENCAQLPSNPHKNLMVGYKNGAPTVGRSTELAQLSSNPHKNQQMDSENCSPAV